MLPFSSKIAIYEWFQQMQGWNRMDFLCSLLNLCNPFELRFIGSCVEDLAQTDYNSLRDQEIKANSAENLEHSTDKSAPEEFRSHVILCLALLQSSNYKVANKLAQILEEQLRFLDLENLMMTGQDEAVEEWLLMLTLASYHPAFRFEEKLNFKTKLTEYERLNKRERKGTRYSRGHRMSLPHQTGPKYLGNDLCEWRQDDRPVLPAYPAYPAAYTQAYLIAYPPQRPDAYMAPGPLETGPQSYTTLRHGAATAVRAPGELHQRPDDNSIMGDRKIGSTQVLTKDERTAWTAAEAARPELLSKPIYVCSSTAPQTTILPAVTQNACLANATVTSSSHPFKLASPPATGSPIKQPTSLGATHPTTSLHSGKNSSYCNHVPVGRGENLGLQSGDVNQQLSANRFSSYAKPNFRYGDSNRTHDAEDGFRKEASPKKAAGACSDSQVSSMRIADNTSEIISILKSSDVPAPKPDGHVCKHEGKSNVIMPTDVTVKFLPANKNDGVPLKKRMCFNLKVKWSDGQTSECNKTVNEMIAFYEEMNSKLRSKYTTDFLSNQNNQVYEKGRRLENYFREAISAPLDLMARKRLSSFLGYPKKSDPTTLSLPLKKRKYKGQRSHIRVDNNSSSSSTASPPLLNTSRSRILSPPSSRRPLSHSHCSADSVPASLLLSSPASTNQDLLTSPPSAQNDGGTSDDDNNSQNSPFFKLFYWLKARKLVDLYEHLKEFTYDEFCKLGPADVDALPGLSREERSVLKKEMENMSMQKGIANQLEVDLDRLAISSKYKDGSESMSDIKMILEDANKAKSDDDSRSGGQAAPAAVELPHDEGEDPLQVAASSSCFSFEFDSSSATVDSSNRSSGPPSQKNSEIELETSYLSVAASVGLESTRCPSDGSSGFEFVDTPRHQGDERKTLSQPDYYAPPEFPYDTTPLYPPTSSMSVPSLHPVSYYKQLSPDEVVVGGPLLVQGQAPAYYQPVQFKSMSTHASHSSDTIISPTFVCAPLYPTTFTTMPSPALSVGTQKPVLLKYTPTSTSGNLQEGTGAVYTAPSPLVPMYPATAQLGTVPQNKYVSSNCAPLVSGYHQTAEQKRDDATVMPQILYATSYGTGPPLTPFPTVPSATIDNPTAVQSYRDSEAEDHVTPPSSDSDVSPRLPEGGIPSGATVVTPDGRYFTASTMATAAQTFVHPGNRVYGPPGAMYRLPAHPDSQWAPVQHAPLGSSYSDPTHYTPMKNDNVRTDYVGGYHAAPNSGPYYLHNGYPEHRGPYPGARDGPRHIPAFPSQKSNFNNQRYSGRRDRVPKRNSPPWCCNCCSRGHTSVECKEPQASEVMSNDFRLRVSQSCNSRQGND